MSLKETIKKIVRLKLASKKQSGDAAKPDHPTWWTCFYYKGENISKLHCTHKYFGDLNQASVNDAKQILADYFDKNPFVPFKVTFDKEKFFGPNKDIRVLTLKDFPESKFLLDLKKDLDKIVPDKFPDYKPHVTDETREIIGKIFKGYALMFGDDIVKSY